MNFKLNYSVRGHSLSYNIKASDHWRSGIKAKESGLCLTLGNTSMLLLLPSCDFTFTFLSAPDVLQACLSSGLNLVDSAARAWVNCRLYSIFTTQVKCSTQEDTVTLSILWIKKKITHIKENAGLRRLAGIQSSFVFGRSVLYTESGWTTRGIISRAFQVENAAWKIFKMGPKKNRVSFVFFHGKELLTAPTS